MTDSEGESCSASAREGDLELGRHGSEDESRGERRREERALLIADGTGAISLFLTLTRLFRLRQPSLSCRDIAAKHSA